MKNIKYLLILICLTILCGCSLTKENNENEYLTLNWDNGYKLSETADKHYSPEEKTEWSADIDYDGNDEKIILNENILTVYKDNNALWSTENEWKVENVIIDDLNLDGEIEINFCLWKKRGRYRKLGQFYESNDTVNCFYIFKWKDGELKPAWLSSPLDNPIFKAVPSDINNDNKKELAVLEEGNGNYAKYVSIWTWNGWGFSNDFRASNDKYEGLSANYGIDDISIKLYK